MLHIDQYLRLFDLLFFAVPGLPNPPQNPQPETFGEGGSKLGGGAVIVVRYIFPSLPLDRLRRLLRFVWLKSPDRYLSSHINPDDPCRLNEVVDRCKPFCSITRTSILGVFCKEFKALQVRSYGFFSMYCYKYI
ncbi:hypothetical protein GQ457_18G003370 [Hibiscus cannabinus]